MLILRRSHSHASPFASADEVATRQDWRGLARTFQFGPFLLQPERQLLLQLGTPVRVGGRALDLLTLLVERAGELVSKQDLISRAWPDTFVDEGNLKVNIAGLRRALGECHAVPRFIATVVGRGYRFIAPVDALVWPLDGYGSMPPVAGDGQPSSCISPAPRATEREQRRGDARSIRAR
jgi:DNA-binding winged helix-turn-helix (wHTH) protein